MVGERARSIRAVLFDKDGTLVDFHRTWSAIARRLALEAADEDAHEAERLLERAGYDTATASFRADSVFAAGTNAEVVALWHPHLGTDGRRALTARFNMITAVEGAEMAVAVEGVPEALAALKKRGLKLGVATNDSTGGAERTVRALGIASLFDATYGYDAVASPKPAPDVVLAFADAMGLRPSEIAMVGDNGHDMACARAAGAGLAVAVLSGTGTRETLSPLAHVVLDSVADLPGWMAGNVEPSPRPLASG
ncbi:MAG: HAD family hydrolase [Rhizobiaceae bacterium]|nr:HAD family hydrolase [Rhizobiaceae bacterium]MCV0405816.1 HAD family hydrolase [Rhizobiaceae bacterium]